jgi:hypothetical protein
MIMTILFIDQDLMHPRGEEPNSAFKRNILTFKVNHL